MPVKLFSAQIIGLEGSLVEVEADLLPGLPDFKIIGLADTAVQESRVRIKSAIKSTPIQFPQQKKIISLAPASVKKSGTSFDLPIALGLLAASGQIDPGKLSDALILGELALDGSLRPISGAISIAIFALKNGWKKVLLPIANLSEASLIDGIQIIGFENFQQVIDYCQKQKLPEIKLPPPIDRQHQNLQQEITLDLIQGQTQAKRALQISAAGGHHLLLYGPPGVGKTLLARALPSILPPLSRQELFEIIQIYSCAKILETYPYLQKIRPFRSVHQTASLVSLIGGGSQIRPGEISLANHGVLFLDEIAEFPRSLIEALRQPLEERKIHLSRANGNFTFPANFTLVAAMNPCPCGFLGDTQKSCTCSAQSVSAYQKKLSGPILDRLDLTVKLARAPFNILEQNRTENNQEQIKNSIQKAAEIQKKRFQNSNFTRNSELNSQSVRKYLKLTPEAETYLKIIAQKINLSPRSILHLLKTALTIADLKSQQIITNFELAEAFQFRESSSNLHEIYSERRE